jgi:hypothetical protein
MSRPLLEFRMRVWRTAWLEDERVDEREVVEALQRLAPCGISCSRPSRRIVQLLVERVVVRVDGLEIRLRVEGISSVVEDLRRREPARTAA